MLDACLKHDPSARVACEALATAGNILVAGEITAKVLPDIPAIVARTVRKAGYEADYEIEVITHDQSTDIAEAVSGDGSVSPQQGRVIRGSCMVTPAWKRMSCFPCRLSWHTA